MTGREHPKVDLVRVASVAAAECVRQQVDLRSLADLIVAYDFTVAHAGERPTVLRILDVGKLVEPGYTWGYRHQPVTFADGGTAAHHDTIERAMTRMFNLLDDTTDPGEFVKAFLDVHPFRDGNGRTAWVLYNWLNGTLGEPVPLPDFYRQETT